MATQLKRMEKRDKANVNDVCERIRQLAYKKGPDAKLPTQRELCDILGASTKTITVALSKLETQNVVLCRQGSGIYVSPYLNRKAVGVVIYSELYCFNATDSPFWGVLLASLMKRAQERAAATESDYRFFFVPPMGEDEHEHRIPEDLVRALDTTGLDGVIAIGGGHNLADLLEQKGVAQVSFAGYGQYMVALNEARFVRDAVAALVKCGCRRIGSLAATTFEEEDGKESPDSRELHRTEFASALAEFGLSLHPELVCFTCMEARDWARAGINPKMLGYERALELWGGPNNDRPDGLVVYEDLMTSGVLAAFARLQLDPVRTVPIATHANANSSLLYPFDKDLIRVEYDINNLVDGLFDLLERVLRGEAIEDRTVRINPTVHLPASTGSPLE